MLEGTPTAPLTSRAAGAVMFRRGAEPVTCGRFLADVAALAARLPDRPYALGLCADRYNALVSFAAVVSRGQVMLLSSDRSSRRRREIAADYPDLYVLADTGEDPSWEAPPDAVRVAPAAPAGAIGPNPRIPLGQVAAIGFTSGSTGVPGAHPKPWGALVAAAEAAGERFNLNHPDGQETTVVATVPPQHMYGFETTMVLPLHAATASHAGPHFFPVEVAEALHAAPGRRVLVTTPLQMRALLGSGQPMPKLQAVISATAPLEASLAEAVERAWQAPVLEIYGATEMGSIASRRTVEGPLWRLYRSVGLRRRTEDVVAAEVAGLPEPVPLADAVELEGEECFRLLGRRTDIVKLGGKRASLARLNALLNGIEGVQDGVFVVPEDLDRNPAARLAVYAVAPARSAEAILAALRQQVDPVFLPRAVTLVPALPRDSVGKLPQQALAALRRQLAGTA
ncbi:acyl-CoA synthetase [Roseomonas sp. M0104]|uniref:Acyl-CoA synthetase n=1 Tax=Teichococcus coralli TaxID=2545983 RepID=A0A845BFV5_9PROT|nr:AMP-binding protein [Pseudoroseomonas coralli]MXP64227.1 acyl-CoA synthetase [Pseudoroseomonas coralli]